ncbi:MAG: hypothetical protein II786_03305 [Muribaculaceae bacterium]|nr:hypothetical protein [Muribaculaceae bacterium]
MRISAQQPFAGKYHSFISHTTQGEYTGWNKVKWADRSVSLSVSYRFGSLNARVKKADKTIENSDVVGGSSAGGGATQQPSQGGN